MLGPKIAATERSPEVDFDFDNHRLRPKGGIPIQRM